MDEVSKGDDGWSAPLVKLGDTSMASSFSARHNQLDIHPQGCILTGLADRLTTWVLCTWMVLRVRRCFRHSSWAFFTAAFFYSFPCVTYRNCAERPTTKSDLFSSSFFIYSLAWVYCFLFLFASPHLGDVQATVSGLFTAAFFLFISHAVHCRNCAERPHANIFCFYVFLSLLGQFALHMLFFISSVKDAEKHMPDECIDPATEFESNMVNTV
ncbi:hypothetical protein Tco_1172849 [Tanacetum coccineum]